VLSLQKLLAAKARTFVLAAGTGLGLAPAVVPTLGVLPARAEALLLVDVESGKVINEQNATAPWYPASVTKLMTAYVTFKALQDHRVTRESLFAVSPRAVAQQPSKMGFKSGTRVTVDNALKMMLVHSANDMAIVLAEGVSGSIEKFTAEMNAQAQRLGMTQTNYVNPNGLPDEQQITSARDLAILARALIRDFPDYGDYWHIPSIRLGRHIYHNTNKLIDAYAGADGMKTGFICASGYNLVATASRGGKRLIAVVLGAKTDNARATNAAELFERGFASDPLSWVRSQSAVEALTPVAATPPPDMHDEVCPEGHHRRPQPAEEGEEANAATDKAMSFGDMPLPGMPTIPTNLLTAGLTAGVAPIDVYTGPARPPGWVPPPAAASKKKSATYAAKPPAQGATAPAGAKPAKPNPGAKPVQRPAAPPPQAAPPADAQ
jgi:D-alanyl-D-alanine carboxypeptidase